jgi:hypothetical protein
VQSTFTTALGAVPIRRVARGSSLVNATRNVIQAIGVAVLATLLAGPLSPEVRAADRARQLATAGEPPGLCVVSAAAAATAASPSARGAARPGTGSDASGRLSAPSGTPADAANARTDSPAGRSASPAMPEGPAACAEHLAGFSDAYMLTFVMSLVALLLGLTLPGWPGPWSGRTGLVAEEE